MYSLEPVFIHTICLFLAISQAVAQELNFFPPSASFSNKIHCSENVCVADIESGMIKIRIYSSFIWNSKEEPKSPAPPAFSIF